MENCDITRVWKQQQSLSRCRCCSHFKPSLLFITRNFHSNANSIGSYKLNGGVLRFSNDNNNANVLLQALANDYLEWAPQLAHHVPLDQQTFGFLGPAALTRTFLDLKDKSKVVLLPPHWVEPSTSTSNSPTMDLCQQSSSSSSSSNSSNSVAIHWSGKERKRNWLTAIRQNACLQKIMSASCPIVLDNN